MPAAVMQTEPPQLRPNADHSESGPSGSTSESESRSSSAFSGTESESDSDDDLSDNETLADRHKSLKRSANSETDQAAKRRRSSSDSGSHLSSGPRRKRRNLFPSIRKSQRCGKCHTCLNPQLKKACLTVREQMMREARQGNSKVHRHAGTTAGQAAARKPAAAPAPSSTTGSSSSSGGGAVAAASAATDVDKYTDILLPFINSAGAISDTSTVQPFVKALSAFSSSMARTLPCTILNLSSAAVLSEFMTKNGVDMISSWMLQAMEEDDDHASQFLVEALSMLKQLPVNKAFVQSTKSAKVVGALRKHDSADVRKLAREVVAMWMKVVSSSAAKSSSAGKPGAAGSGDATGAAAASLPTAKRLKTTGQAAGSGTAASQQKPSGPGANGAAARSGTGAVPAAASAGAAAGASSIHMVSDGDLFKPAAASKPRPRVGLGIPQRRSHAVQQLDPTEAAKLLGTKQQQLTEAAGQPQHAQGHADAAAAAQEARVQVELVVLPNDEAVTVKLVVQQPVSIAVAGPAALGTRVPGSNAARLQGVRKFGMALGPRAGAAASNASTNSSISALMSGAWANTSSGAGSSPGVPGASDTAAVEGTGAGAGVDAGAGREVKQQRKKRRVTWRDERDLVAVRWFIKDDPPAQAKQDAHLSEEQLRALTAAQHHHHTAFDQAARREHARERQLIEQQHKEAEEKAQHMRQLIDAMQPEVEWTSAPPPVVLDPQWQVAAGEGSDLAQAEPRPVHQIVHQLLQPMLVEPYEPHQLLQVPSAFFNVPYHDRNVKIVPLNTVAAATASGAMEAGGPLPMELQQVPMQQQQEQQLQLQQLPPQTIVLQSVPPQQQQQQQQQQQSLIPGLALPGQGQQLVLQPVPQQPPQQQQQHPVQHSMQMQPQLQQQMLQGGPPPPQQQQQQAGYGSLYAQPGPPSSSGPPSNNNSQAQLLQALQSLTQLQSQGGLPAAGAQQQPAPQQQQLMTPGSSAPQLLVSTGGMQLVLPPGVQQLPQAQQPPQILQLPPGVQLPPGMVLVPQQQQQQQQLQQPQLYDIRGQPLPPPSHPAAGHLQTLHYEPQQHRPMLRDSGSGAPPTHHGPPPDWQQQQHQWHHHDGQGRGRGSLGRGVGGGRGVGRGAPDEVDENAWRRTQRVCKFFPLPRGCTKGNKCAFRHVPPGEELDVRDERRMA